MSVLYVVLPLALVLGGAGCLACLACIMDGQYDDLESPGLRVLIDEPAAPLGKDGQSQG
jgi:cbb3-type cytochrome oxidase maturation protein